MPGAAKRSDVPSQAPVTLRNNMYFVFPKAQPQSFSKLPLLTSSDYLMSSVVFVCVESC